MKEVVQLWISWGIRRRFEPAHLIPKLTQAVDFVILRRSDEMGDRARATAQSRSCIR